MDKKQKKYLAWALAILAIILLSGNTLAYYTAVDTATNVVTSGNIRLRIHERTADGSEFPESGVTVIPGDVISKQVTIENICGHPFYLRVKLVYSINSQVLSVDDCIRPNLNQDDWTLQNDGYCYYNNILQPNQFTSPIFTEVEIVGDKVDQNYIGKLMTLSVIAEAVQSEHNPAQKPWEASGWPTA